MQIFIIGSPLETAEILDKRRLNKQIIECKQICNALNGDGAWSNHPCVLQYKDHMAWLGHYHNCLMFYQRKEYLLADIESKFAMLYQPHWHTYEYLTQMKRRLYTKDKEYYAQWAELGESQENWYYVDGIWRKYINGKRIE